MLRESLYNEKYLRRLVWIWYVKSKDFLFNKLSDALIGLIIANYFFDDSQLDNIKKVIYYRQQKQDVKAKKLLRYSIKDFLKSDLKNIVFEDVISL